MAQTMGISMFAAMCLICASQVLADDCAPYVNADMNLVPKQQCILLTSCGGTCTNRYCIFGGSLDQSQIMCLVNNLYAIIGVSILFFVLLVCGIVASCCKYCFLASMVSSNSMI